jgi:precorrin-2 dehydrogenase/sirohydrochlorin ferrochelatase
VSALPIALHGENVRALVIGGGDVGTRKALALLDAGAQVRVVAPEVTPQLAKAAAGNRLVVRREPYGPDALSDETLVFAATSSREVNSRVAADARARGRLVNVVDSPEEGDFHSMALHRSGDLTIAVSTSGVPTAAVRIRDTLATRFDARYGRALSALRGLRLKLRSGAGDPWNRATTELIGEDFCESVESGSLPEKVGAWR